MVVVDDTVYLFANAAMIDGLLAKFFLHICLHLTDLAVPNKTLHPTLSLCMTYLKLGIIACNLYAIKHSISERQGGCHKRQLHDNYDKWLATGQHTRYAPHAPGCVCMCVSDRTNACRMTIGQHE